MSPSKQYNDRLAKTAAAFIEEDERLELSLPEGKPARWARLKGKRLSDEWQRIIFYLVTGIAVLAIMLAFTEQLNPPDSALRSQSMIPSLAPWDGTWQGTLTRQTIAGVKLGEVQTRRAFRSSGASVQTISVSYTEADGTEVHQLWVCQLSEDGRFTLHDSSGGAAAIPLEGQLLGRMSQTYGQKDGRIYKVYSWVEGSTMYYYRLEMPVNNPNSGVETLGYLHRIEAGTE